jgi:hypothetical protein
VAGVHDSYLVLHVALDVGIDRAVIVVLDVVLNVGHLVDGIYPIDARSYLCLWMSALTSSKSRLP